MFYKLSLIVILFLIFLILNWVLWLRTWLKNQPWEWSQRYFQWLEPWEVTLYQKSETILWARTKAVVGLLLTLLQTLDGLDVTPLMPFLPSRYQWWLQVAINVLPLSLTIIGMVDEKLRRDTTQPLAFVSITDQELRHNPTMAAAVANFEEVKQDTAATLEAVNAAS